MPEGFTLEEREIVKENDIKKLAFEVTKEGTGGGCVFYIDPMYDRYQNGVEIPTFVSEVLQEITKSEIFTEDFNELCSRENLLRNTVFRMTNKYTSKEWLKDVVTKEIPGITDIVLYPVIEVTVASRLRGTMRLTNYILENAGISVEEIHAAAEANTERRMKIIPLTERLRLIGNQVPEMFDSPFMENQVPVMFDSPFLVSYDSESMGEEASILGAPKVLASLNDESYYVIPSSTHELLFLPKSFTEDLEYLKQMVAEVNAGVLEASDILSYNVFELDHGEFTTHEVQAYREMVV